MDCSPPTSSVHGILQARILEWVAMPPPGDLPNPGIELSSLSFPALGGGFFTTEPPGKPPEILTFLPRTCAMCMLAQFYLIDPCLFVFFY